MDSKDDNLNTQGIGEEQTKDTNTGSMPRVLLEGKTPAEWVAIFAQRGLELSERKLREKARLLNAFCAVGNVMLLKPEHIDLIFEESQCRSKSTSEHASGRHKAASMASNVVLEKALALAEKQSQEPQSRKPKGRRHSARSKDQMRDLK